MTKKQASQWFVHTRNDSQNHSMHPLLVSQPTTCKLPTTWGLVCSGTWCYIMSGMWHFEGTVILQNVMNHSPTDTVSNPSKQVNSGTVLRKPRILLYNKHIWEPRAAKVLYHRAPTLGYYGSPNHSCSQPDSSNEHMTTAPFVCSCMLQSSSHMNTKWHTEINKLP